VSDTPLTDAAKEGGESWMELAALSAVLERENAALREDRDLFRYLCWLEENRDHDVDLKGAYYLVIASDGTTLWGKTYREAVMAAEKYERAAIDAARKEAQP
jgi:ribulose-5-phosphate 4-epimerase/fuculose-1-phosphate aldolase